MILDAKQFQERHSVFVAEASSLGLPPGKVLPNFTMTNCPKAGMLRGFKLVKTDMSRDGESVAGWQYEEEDGVNKGLTMDGGAVKAALILKVLIIND